MTTLVALLPLRGDGRKAPCRKRNKKKKKCAGVSPAFISISEYINITIGSEFRSTLISSYLGLGYRSGVRISYAF